MSPDISFPGTSGERGLNANERCHEMTRNTFDQHKPMLQSQSTEDLTNLKRLLFRRHTLLERAFFCSALLLLLASFPGHLVAQAQAVDEPRRGTNEVFTGYSFFSNSFNGHSTGASHQPLNGWEVSLDFPVSGRFNFVVDGSGYYGTSLGSPQHPIFVLCGVQFNRHFRKETAFLQGLGGLGHINSDFWGGLAHPTTNSFVGSGGGGLDTPISSRLAFRVKADFIYASFTIPDNQIHNQPNYFARISTGLVWRF
jgi:hypothetical protein